MRTFTSVPTAVFGVKDYRRIKSAPGKARLSGIALLFLRHRCCGLQDQQHPGRAVKREVEPVDWPDELAFGQHLELLPDMGRGEGGKSEGQAGKNKKAPRQFHYEFQQSLVSSSRSSGFPDGGALRCAAKAMP